MKSVSLAGEVTERIFSIHLDGETISIRTNTYHTILTELKFLHTDYKEKILGSYVAVMLWMGKEENRDAKRWSDLKYIKHLLEVEKVGTSNYFKLFSGDKKTNVEEYWEQEKKYNKPRRVVGFAHYPDEKRISFLGEWKCFDNVIRYLPVGTSYIFRSEETLTKWKEKSLKNNQYLIDFTADDGYYKMKDRYWPDGMPETYYNCK